MPFVRSLISSVVIACTQNRLNDGKEQTSKKSVEAGSQT